MRTGLFLEKLVRVRAESRREFPDRVYLGIRLTVLNFADESLMLAGPCNTLARWRRLPGPADAGHD